MSSGDILRGPERGLVLNRLRASIGLRLEMPLLLGDLAVAPGGRTLEVGAGLGWGSVALVRAFEPSLAVVSDYDAAVIAAMRAYVEDPAAPTRVAQAVIDAKALPFPDASFDAVLSLYALHHVMGYARAIAEAARVLCPGGVYLVAEPLRAWPFLRLRGHAPPDGLASPGELRAMLSATGLVVERWRGLPFWAYVVARRAR